MPDEDWGIQIKRNVGLILKAESEAGQKELAKIGIDATNKIKLLVTNPPGSAPGAPPGLRTGGLRLSYKWELGGLGDRRYVAIFSDPATRQPGTGRKVNYVHFVEFGTSRMAPRPHFRPVMATVRAEAPQRIKDAMDRAAYNERRRLAK